MTDERAAVEHKRCPLCGSRPRVENHKRIGLEAWCGGDEDKPCFMRRWPIPLDQWNTRPIEDALRAENTELSARVSELTRLLAEAEDAVREARDLPHFDSSDSPSDHAATWEEWDKWKKRPFVQRALQSGEGKEPSR